MKFNGYMLAQEYSIQVQYTGVLSFEKVLFSRSSTDQTSPGGHFNFICMAQKGECPPGKQATKGVYIWFFVKGHEVDQGSEEKGEVTFVAADHDSSVSVHFSIRNCQDSYPRYQNR